MNPSRVRLRALALIVGLTMTSPALTLSGAGAAASGSTSPTTTTTATSAPTAEGKRVDLDRPSFSHPTRITNPLFPISKLRRTVLLGTSDGVRQRAETTLLPGTKSIKWHGQQVETLVSQYVGYLDGRIHELAYDFYAQADDGSVWYFGEDVFNYERGVIVNTEGTWLAGRDGPAGMIMPAHPKVGDVYRPENIPGLVFETVTVQATGLTVHGPRGHARGAIAIREKLMDGTIENKIFAPGYGEFLTGVGENLEELAIAVPTDAVPGRLPAELATLSTGASRIFSMAAAGNWNAASSTVDQLIAAWDSYQRRDVPRMLDSQMSEALVRLVAAVDARAAVEARQAALDVERAGLDLELQYRSPVKVDLALLDVWARQKALDSAAGDRAGVRSDMAILSAIRARVAPFLGGSGPGAAM